MPGHAHRPPSHPPAPPRAAGGPDAARLSSLAQELARAGRDGHAALVGVAPCGAGRVDLHLRAADGDLLDAIVGWRPPPTWWAVGLLAPAVAVRPGVAPAPSPAPESRWAEEPVGTALLVARDGSLAAALADRRGALPLAAVQPATTARAEELCRRALGLPTPPCTASPRRLWAAVWLDAVTGFAAGRPPSAAPLRWPAIAALHPLRSALPPAAPPEPAQLARLAGHPAARASWRSLRQAASASLLTFPETSPTLADWFDDGSFGRWLLGRYPTPEHLLAALADLLAPADHRALVRTAAAWDVNDDHRVGPNEPAGSTPHAGRHPTASRLPPHTLPTPDPGADGGPPSRSGPRGAR